MAQDPKQQADEDALREEAYGKRGARLRKVVPKKRKETGGEAAARERLNDYNIQRQIERARAKKGKR